VTVFEHLEYFSTLIEFDKIWRNVYVLKLDSAYCFHFSLLTPFIFQDYQLREKQARKTSFDAIAYNFIHIFQMLFRLFFIPRWRNFYLRRKYFTCFCKTVRPARVTCVSLKKSFRSVFPYVSAVPKNLYTRILGFPVSISKCWDGSQDSKLPLHASHVALPI